MGIAVCKCHPYYLIVVQQVIYKAEQHIYIFYIMDTQMVSIKKKIVKNTIANTLLKISQYIIGFMLFPFIITYVGVEDYGIYLLVGAFIGYFGLLDLGIGSALVKYVAQYTTKDDKKTINEMVNSSFLFYLGIGIVVCISVLIVGTFFIEFFSVEGDQLNKARFISYLVAIGALTSWPMRSFGTILHGLQRYDIDVAIQFIVAIINAVVTVVVLLNGGNIIDLIFWGIVIGVIGQLATVIVSQKLLPYLELRFEYMGMDVMRKIFKFSSVVFIGQIIGIIILGTDKLIIGAFISVAAITHYAIARKLHDLVNTASSLPSSALLPAATELETQDNKGALERLVLKGGKYKAALILSTATIIFVLAKPIITLWMGPEFAFMAQATQVYVSYWFVFAAWGVISAPLYAQERFKPILYFNFGIAIMNLVLSLVLVQYYGLLGVVMGTAIPYFIIMPVLIPYGLKLIHINIKKYFREVIWKTYPIAFVTGIEIFLVHHFMQSLMGSFIGLGALILLGFGTYFGLFYLFSLKRKEKVDLMRFFRLA